MNPEPSSPFVLEAENRLGKMTFWLLLSEKSFVSIAFFFLAIVFTIARGSSAVPAEAVRFLALGGVVSFGVFFVAFAFALISTWLIYINCTFALTDDALKIKKGIFTEKEIAIPYRQIQNVSIERNFSDQIFGLSRVIISTAGHDNDKTPEDESKGILPPISKARALALQMELLKRADVQKVLQSTI